MKHVLFIPLFIISSCEVLAQVHDSQDSIRAIISLRKGNATEVDALNYLGLEQVQFDSAIKYAQQGLALSKEINYKKGEADCYLLFAKIYHDQRNNVSQVIQYSLNALAIYKEIRDTIGIVSSHLYLQSNYREAGNYSNSLKNALEGLKLAEEHNLMGTKMTFFNHRLAPLFLAEIGQTYLLMNQLDSALLYTQKSISKNELFNGVSWGFPVYLLATVRGLLGDYKNAQKNYHLAISLSIKNGHPIDTLQYFSGLSTLFTLTGEFDSAIYYARKVQRSWNPQSENKNLIEAINNLGRSYKLKGNIDSAVKYIELSHALKDSIFSIEKDREVQNITFNERQRQQEIITARIEYENQVKLFIVITGLVIFFLIAILLFRNNRVKQRAYAKLEKQKQETDIQKGKVEQALRELKSAQAQLIQSEKMASLGELTAGIAHEIQNPLNFVNNFSEVNTELIAEMKRELEKGNINDAKTIADHIDENEKKIIFHGKRADGIVKGMLQHSRSSSGVKEPTDINALADEYFRLAFHGLRAKDKSFNATMRTDFDRSIENIPVVPQDIGRVILNLITNAFYAVSEKKKQVGDEFNPTVVITTKRVSQHILISVRDNGNGIPPKVVDKIFQPFFTTKPTGQGTGLGLSLSYEIVKAHEGDLTIETKEGEGARFTIQLPV